MVNISLSETINYLNTIFPEILSKLIVAIIIILLGFIIGKVLGKITQKVLHEIELNNIVKKSTGVKISLEEIIGRFTSYFIYFISIIMALNQIGLATTVLYIISGGLVILIILLTFLAIKDFIPNFFSGLFIQYKNMIKEGNSIKVGNVEGKVKKIGLVETEIITPNKDKIILPNSLITKSEVVIKK